MVSAIVRHSGKALLYEIAFSRLPLRRFFRTHEIPRLWLRQHRR